MSAPEHGAALAQAEKTAWQAYMAARSGDERAPHVTEIELAELLVTWRRAADAAAAYAIESMSPEDRAAFEADSRAVTP